MIWKNIIWYELIGFKVKVIRVFYLELVGIEGYVFDEMRNIFVLVGDRVWVVLKDVVEIEFDFGNEKICVNGKDLVGRFEMRFKKRWWK